MVTRSERVIASAKSATGFQVIPRVSVRPLTSMIGIADEQAVVAGNWRVGDVDEIGL